LSSNQALGYSSIYSRKSYNFVIAQACKNVAQVSTKEGYEKECTSGNVLEKQKKIKHIYPARHYNMMPPMQYLKVSSQYVSLQYPNAIIGIGSLCYPKIWVKYVSSNVSSSETAKIDFCKSIVQRKRKAHSNNDSAHRRRSEVSIPHIIAG
jgi:hypothetical protein